MEKISIKALRVNNNLTCEDMGKMLGISKQAYALKESGRTNFTGDELIIICNELNVDCRILKLNRK